MTISPKETEEQAPATTATYVYGVVRSGSLASVSSDGVSATQVAILEGDGVAALVSDLPNAELRVRRNDLRRHLDVIEEAFRRTTVLPCRFGTVLDSRDGVREELLAALRGTDEAASSSACDRAPEFGAAAVRPLERQPTPGSSP